MTDFPPKNCPQCGLRGLERVYQVSFRGAVDANQESENNGLGRFYPGLGKEYLDPKTKTKKNPATHCRSQRRAIDAFKAQGYDEVKPC